MLLSLWVIHVAFTQRDSKMDHPERKQHGSPREIATWITQRESNMDHPEIQRHRGHWENNMDHSEDREKATWITLSPVCFVWKILPPVMRPLDMINEYTNKQ